MAKREGMIFKFFEKWKQRKMIKLAKDMLKDNPSLEKNLKALNNNEPFKRQFEDIDETFNGKVTGNKVLGKECSFCSYKKTCWEGLQYLPQQQSKAMNPKYFWYTKVENPKEEHDNS